jgi:hypothetical protein
MNMINLMRFLPTLLGRALVLAGLVDAVRRRRRRRPRPRPPAD